LHPKGPSLKEKKKQTKHPDCPPESLLHQLLEPRQSHLYF